MVIWEDAHTEDGTWIRKSMAKALEPTIFRQVGFLLEDTAEAVVLTSAMQHGEEEDPCFAARDRIPRGMVRAMHDLVTIQSAAPEPRAPRRKPIVAK